MAIKFAILGLLSWRPFSGYDMKKVLADSSALYWSGNNSNQVYPSLVQLHKDGLVTVEVEQDAGYPPRKVYSITAQGVCQLKGLGGFHAGSAAASQYVPHAARLGRSSERLRTDFASGRLRERGHHETADAAGAGVRRDPPAPRRTAREIYLWDMIAAHDTAHYAHELSWLAELRSGLGLPASPPKPGNAAQEGAHLGSSAHL